MITKNDQGLDELREKGLFDFSDLCACMLSLEARKDSWDSADFWLDSAIAILQPVGEHRCRLHYLKILVHLINETCEELIGILLLSHVKFFVPHLENLFNNK